MSPYKDPARQKEFQREWMRDRRDDYLATHPCVVCGSTERLEIHHRNPADKVSHRVWSWSTERRQAELAKCDVLCWQHHQDQTTVYLGSLFRQHGTKSRYRDGCRCEPCIEAFRVAKRAAYARRVERQRPALPRAA